MSPEMRRLLRRRALGRLLRGLTLGLFGLLGLVLSACASGDGKQHPVQSVASRRAQVAGQGPVRLAVIVMENEEYADIIGSPAAPYINGLARRSGTATQMYAIRHPSLPNYLALISGSTHGIADDCTDCTVRGPNLAQQLTDHAISWRAYEEDLPHPCFTGGGSGAYAKKHDPFLYFPFVTSRPLVCAHVVPFADLAGDERAGLPAFSFITPNLCHDMHDCDTATGDRFLSHTVPALLHALGPRGVLFLVWDEGTSDNGCCRLAGGGHIATIVAGPGVRPGARLGTPVDTYSVLATIEDLLGLRRLGGAACACTPSLQPLLRRR
jgi:phosphatidylinositol-3-phosphatase